MEDSLCFSGWYYLTRVPALSSCPSQAQQGHTVDTPLPHQSAIHAAMSPS